MGERHLRGVALAVEHALAKEGGAERHPVETADEPAVPIHLDRVAMAEVEQLAVKPADAGVDPGLVAVAARLGATGDDGVEVPVDPDLERVGAQGAGKAPRHVKTVERDDAALRSE